MKQFSLLLLIGVMSWLAWHLGTPEARHGSRLDIPPHQSQSLDATDARHTIQRAAVQSERFLARSASTLKEDSIEVIEQVKPASSRDRWLHPSPSQTESSTAGESGLNQIGHAVGQAWVGVQPIANAAWGAIQTGWHRLTTDNQSLMKPVPNHPHKSRIRHREEITDSKPALY